MKNHFGGIRAFVLIASAFLTFNQDVWGQTNVLMQHNDIGRTGQSLTETILTPANVSSGNFGKLFSAGVDGQIYAQPLYLSSVNIPNAGTHNVVFVATMHDSVYAFDADTAGAPLWQATLLDAAHGAAAGATSDPVSTTGCTMLGGNEMGIIGTPVIDPAGGTIYVVSRTLENGYPVERLHALDVTTGGEKTTPVTLAASVPGTGTGSSNGVLKFDPKWENQRAGLLLLNGVVYIAFGGFCEAGPFHGWVLAYNATTLAQTSVFTPSPNASGSGIWMSGTGLAADVSAGKPFGRMFLVTGNGTYDAAPPYKTNAADYGDDVLQLDLTNGIMTVTDAFTPLDQATLQSSQLDLASGGVMLLPDQSLAGHTHQMLAGGKNGNLYLIDRDSLGGYSTAANNIIEPIVPAQVGGVYGSSAYWNNHVYIWGNEDTLKQFNFTDGLMNFWHSANSTESQTFPASTPSISANGNTNGIVWNIDPSAWNNGGNANLIAHDATNVATTLYTSATNAARDNPGRAVKFAVPTIANGKVYVPTYGQLSVYGLLSMPDFALTPAQSSVSLSQGTTATDTITVTAVNGFSGTLNLSASGLPAELTVSFNQNLTTGAQVVTLSAGSNVKPGTYSVVITGTAAGKSHSLTLNVTVVSAGPPVTGFTLNAAPRIVSLVQGQSTSTSISVVPANGFSSAVTLSATNLPSGVTATFNNFSGNLYTMTLTSSLSTVSGVYPITVQGSGGGVVNSANLTLVTNAVGQTNVLTQHNDMARTGQNNNETILTPANVSGGNFGKLFSNNVDGQVYAQPLYFSNLSIPGLGTHNVVFVATMHDSLYAFDADSGATLWQITLLDAAHGASAGATTDPQTDTGCNELVGTELGITSTPVIDPAGGTIYVVGKTLENGYPLMRLHALDITTGAERVAPVALAAAVAGNGTGSSNGILTFDPKWENQRPGLLLVNGIIYIGFAAYCDNGPYHGWVLAYNATTLTQTSVFNATPNGSGSGIWLSGAGLAADIPPGQPYGRLFFSTGNGTYDATLPYTTNIADYSDDVLRMDLTNGIMKVTDQFTPLDQDTLRINDSDLAAGGVMLLPDQPLSGHTHQMLAAGKTGVIYVIDRDNLGGYSTAANNIIETITPHQIGGAFSIPAYWNNHAYYWGNNDNLTQFNFNGGLMNAYHSFNSSEKQSFPGSTPSVSSNGNTNGIVWNIDTSAWTTNGNANLIAHDATNVSTTLYTSATNPARDNPGPATKFAVPTISNGKVYVATYGQLSVYGLLTTTPDFTLTTTQGSLSLVDGSSTTGTIYINALNGFTDNVTLAASGLPAGLTASFQAGVTAATSTLTLSADVTTTAGTYPIVITGVSGALTHTVSILVTTTTTAVPSFGLTASPTFLSIPQGQSVTASIKVTPVNGFNSAITLSAAGLLSGVSASFSPIVNNTSTLTITAASTASIGTATLLINGTSGSLQANTSIRTSVTAAGPSFNLNVSPSSYTLAAGQGGTLNLSATPTNGFSGTVTFTVSGLPANVSSAIQTVSPTAATLVLYAGPTTVPGPYPVTVTGTSGTLTLTSNFTLTITAASSFALTVSPASTTVTPGQSVTSRISVVPANGFTGTPTLAVSGLPAGVSASISPISGNAATLTLSAAGTAAATTANIVITGTSGSLTASTALALTVTPAASFALTASPASLSIPKAQSGSSSITTVPANGFTSAVSLSASGLPAGGTATFSASTGNSSVMTISTTSATPTGTFTITIKGTGGMLSATTTVSLTIVSSPVFTTPVIVDLSPYFNIYGISNNGTQPGNGGFDSAGYAYSASLIGTSITWSGVKFPLGPSGVADAVSSQTIAVPAGRYPTLKVLAAGVFGNQTNQTFTVNYTDGTTAKFVQSISDWGSKNTYSGESVALSMSYRITPSRTTQTGPWRVYGYSFTLDSTKTVSSITLPNNRSVVVLALEL